MAQELAEQNAEQKGDSKFGKTWLESFFDRHSNVSLKFGSNLDHQRALAGSPRPIIDYFHKLRKALKEYNFLPENICGMGGKGLPWACRTVRRLFVDQGAILHKMECVS